MKTPRQNARSFEFWRVLLVPVVFLAVFAVGCSKGGGGGSGGGGGNGFRSNSCTNCNFTEYPLVQALGEVSTGTTAFQLSLDFYGDSTAAPYGAIDQQHELDKYIGPIGAQGDLYVDFDNGTCGLAPGRYELKTLQAGRTANIQGPYGPLGASTFYSLRLEGTLAEVDGGVRAGSGYALGERIVISLSASTGNIIQHQGISYDYYGYDYDFRVQKTVTIESVAGHTCNARYEMY